MAAAIERGRSSALQTGISTLLVALSFPLVVYGSEARGHSLAIFFSLCSFFFLERYRKTSGLASLGLLHASIILGFLSHLNYLFVFLSLLVLSAYRSRAAGRSAMACVTSLMRLYLLPGVIVMILYSRFLLAGTLDFGPPTDLFAVLRRWMTLIPGGPDEGLRGTGLAVVVAGVLLYGILRLRRRGDDVWVFFAALLVVPALVCVVARPPFIHVRYFMAGFPFLLLLLGEALCPLAKRGTRGRLTLALLVALVVAGNAYHIATFLRVGRGHYAEAVSYMFDHTRGPDVTVTSDHDFRNGLLLDFYAPRVNSTKKLAYSSLSAVPGTAPEWLILHRFERDPTMPRALVLKGALRYRLVYHAPYFGELSGFHWFIYQRLPPGGP